MKIVLRLITLLCWIFENTEAMMKIERKGDINFVLYLPLCLKDGLTMNAAFLIEAMEFELFNNSIHAKTQLTREQANITLGYVIYDTCNAENKIAEHIIERLLSNNVASHLKTCNCSDEINDGMVMVMTTMDEEQTALVANVFLGYENHKLITLSDNSPQLEPILYPNYFRMQEDEVKAFVVYRTLIEFYNWKNIGLVYSTGTYGKVGYNTAINIFAYATFCVSFTGQFQRDGNRNIDMIKRLKENNYLDAVILWLTAEESDDFFRLAGRLVIHNRTWICSPSVSNLDLAFFSAYDPFVVQGTIYLKNQREVYDESFQNFFWNLTVKDINEKWWTKITNLFFYGNISRNIQVLKENISPWTYLTAQKLLPPLRATKYAIDSAITENGNRSKQYLTSEVNTWVKTFLVTLSFFLGDQSISLLQIDPFSKAVNLTSIATVSIMLQLGFIDVEGNGTWSGYKTTVPASKCDDVCKPGFYPAYINQKCCWLCFKCKKGFFKAMFGNKMCEKCPVNKEASHDRTSCISYTKLYVLHNTVHAYVMYCFVFAAFFPSLFVLIYFIKEKDTPVVRASNLTLSICQLTSHLLLSVVSLFLIGKVGNFSCIATLALHGFLLCIILSITFTKTIILVDIFHRKVVFHHSAMTMALHYICIFIILIIYCFLVTVIIILSPNGLQSVRQKEQLQIELSCGNNMLLITQLVYIVLLNILCMIQAFKARTLPSYFNEAKYILYSTFGNAVIFTMTTLLYGSIPDIATKTVLFHAAIFSFNICTLTLTFGPKLFIIICRPRENSVRVFQKELYNHMKERVDMKVFSRKTME
ncbi:extracellular calcium-sensing receptor-like [Hydractinia symbiolongicarpus]|uniref:extracellular calcium-sensing receptor-like n=1 Tax=Hydractinia symbiolongicarpus TaxID=13093 RepID=UPI002549EB7C|nr:extracellular calcium-sensing receptor-like [Hydractinia symbiolongicarpus]